MKRLLLPVAALVVALAALPALAQEAEVSHDELRAGERFTITATLDLPAGTELSVDAGNPAWGPLEIIATETTRSGTAVTIEVIAAPFATGPVTIAPAFLLTTAGRFETRTLEPLTITVQPTLAPGDPLELSPLAGPRPIAGAESALLMPAIVTGVILGVLVPAALIVLAIRWARRRRRNRPVPVPPPLPEVRPGLDATEALMREDLVAAYRQLATLVRDTVSDQHHLPAESLTAAELDTRLRQAGDPTTARLARDILRECEAVVYGGYLPAPDRRHAALSMARAIIEPGPA